jgi:membrane-associated protease RseP (regulator of RpoE activity)
MKHLESIAKPVVVAVLICTFLYVYFIYLKGGNILSLVRPPSQTEKEWEDVPPKDPAIVPLAGPAVQDQNPAVPETPLTSPSANREVVPPAQPDPNAPRQPLILRDINLQEGHWIGLEVIPLTAAIAHANNIPPKVTGVLVDEVTLLSAEAGLFAGDVIMAINGRKISDLKSFRLATKEVAQASRATVSVFSGGKEKDQVIISNEPLGIAQMEAAPMILATDKSPHGYYGPCDKCHAIAKTALNSNQMAKDQGDSLTKIAPNIRAGTRPPHRNRGTCTKCHVVL